MHLCDTIEQWQHDGKGPKEDHAAQVLLQVVICYTAEAQRLQIEDEQGSKLKETHQSIRPRN